MEVNKTKNFKELEKVEQSCKEKGDTLFAIFAPNAKGNKSKNMGCLTCSGDAGAIMMGFVHLFKQAVKEKDEDTTKVCNAILSAIACILSQDDETSNKFAECLAHAVHDAKQSAMEKRDKKSAQELCDWADEFLETFVRLSDAIMDLRKQVRRKTKKQNKKQDGKA